VRLFSPNDFPTSILHFTMLLNGLFFVQIVYQRITNGMVLEQTRMRKILASTICAGKMTQKLICQRGIIFLICGSDPLYFNTVIKYMSSYINYINKMFVISAVYTVYIKIYEEAGSDY